MRQREGVKEVWEFLKGMKYITGVNGLGPSDFKLSVEEKEEEEKKEEKKEVRRRRVIIVPAGATRRDCFYLWLQEFLLGKYETFLTLRGLLQKGKTYKYYKKTCVIPMNEIEFWLNFRRALGIKKTIKRLRDKDEHGEHVEYLKVPREKEARSNFSAYMGREMFLGGE